MPKLVISGSYQRANGNTYRMARLIDYPELSDRDEADQLAEQAVQMLREAGFEEPTSHMLGVYGSRIPLDLRLTAAVENMKRAKTALQKPTPT